MAWIVGLLIALLVAIALLVLTSERDRKPRKHGEATSNRPTPRSPAARAAVNLQADYWSCDPEALARLRAQPVGSLSWEQRLRLLHLACLEMLSEEPAKRMLMSGQMAPTEAPEGPNRELVEKLLAVFTSKSSPYRPRQVAVWQGKQRAPGKREPDLQGVLRNASLTHLGCIEVLRLDEKRQARELCFVPFDNLRGIVFAGQALFRLAKLYYDDGHEDEFVLVPLLYGISWSTPNSFDQDGKLTRFLCSVAVEGSESQYSIGVGHQDFVIEGDGEILLGLSSLAEFSMGLSTDDPKFRDKCRARGLDPEEVLRAAGEL